MNNKHLAGCFAMKLVSMIIVMMVMSQKNICEMTANGQNEMNCERERVGVFVSMVHKLCHEVEYRVSRGWKYCTRRWRKRYQFSFICDRFDDFASGDSFSIHRTHTYTRAHFQAFLTPLQVLLTFTRINWTKPERRCTSYIQNSDRITNTNAHLH